MQILFWPSSYHATIYSLHCIQFLLGLPFGILNIKLVKPTMETIGRVLAGSGFRKQGYHRKLFEAKVDSVHWYRDTLSFYSMV